MISPPAPARHPRAHRALPAPAGTLTPIVGADARLRRDALVNAGAILGHDTDVGEAAHAAGAVVLEDVPDGGRVAGVPARSIRGGGPR